MYTVSQKTSHIWLWHTWTDFDIFFGRNATDKVASQKTLYNVISITCASAVTDKTGNTKIAFPLALLVHCQNSTSPCLISSIFLTHDSYAAVWLPKFCKQCVQLGFFWGAWFRREEVKSATTVGMCCTHKAPAHCLLGFLFRKVMQKH